LRRVHQGTSPTLALLKLGGGALKGFGPNAPGGRVLRRLPTGRAGRLVGIVAVAGAMVVFASGCQITSGVQYVSHRAPDGVDLYFKVPQHWSVFDTKQVLQAENGPLGPTQLKQIAGGEWVEAMTPRPGAKPGSALGYLGKFPTARVVTVPLGVAARDGMNFQAMRSLVLPSDPLTATSGYQVLNYSEFALSGGIRGIKMIVNVTNTSPVLTFGQITAVDAKTNFLFMVTVGCEASCWGENASAVSTLLNSWTVKEQAP